MRPRTAPPVAFPKGDAGPTNTLGLPRSRRDLSDKRKEGMRSSTLMAGTVARGRVITAMVIFSPSVELERESDLRREIPSQGRFRGRLAQLARASPLQGGGRGFESLSAHNTRVVAGQRSHPPAPQ